MVVDKELPQCPVATAVGGYGKLIFVF